MFTCGICKKSFLESSQLATHSKKKHPINLKRKRTNSSSESDTPTCELCSRSLERCKCSSYTGVYSSEPYICKTARKRKLSKKQFNTAFYQNMATRPLHSFSQSKGNVNGYLRSSQVGAHFNFQSVPLIYGVRQKDVIGARHNRAIHSGLYFSHEGMNLHPSQLNDIFYKVVTGNSYSKEQAFQLAGRSFTSSNLFKRIDPKSPQKISELEEYTSSKSIFSGDIIPPKYGRTFKKTGHVLTDKKLEDNVRTCQAVVNDKQICALKYLSVFHFHEYPCIGVLIATPKNITEMDCTSQWTQFIMSIYLGICDLFYHTNTNDLKVYAKTSFGHVETTLAECYEVIRINVGLLVDKQIQDLINTLVFLNTQLANLYHNAELVVSNDNFSVNYSIPENLFTLEGQKRNTRHVDGLSKNNSYFYGYAFRFINNYTDREIDNDHLLLNILKNASPFNLERETPKIYQKYLARESVDLINKINLLYGINLSRVEDESDKLYPIIYETLRYTMGELIYNKYVSPHDELEGDGYGSSSDCDDEVDETRVYARKYVLPFGMRAIGLAKYLAELLHKYQSSNVTSDQMYYETGEMTMSFYVPDNLKKKPKTSLVLKDANYLPNSFKKSQTDSHTSGYSLSDAHVIDITSSQSAAIGRMVREHIVTQKKRFIIFVSSLTKNEFGGTDTIGCGMLRIFSTDENDLERVTKNINSRAQSKPSGFVNMMRRGVKYEFGMVQNSHIFSALKQSESSPRQKSKTAPSAFPTSKNPSFVEQRSRVITHVDNRDTARYQNLVAAINAQKNSHRLHSGTPLNRTQLNQLALGGGPSKSKKKSTIPPQFSMGKSIIENSGKGNCWYYSVGRALGYSENQSSEVRALIGSYLIDWFYATPDDNPVTNFILMIASTAQLTSYLGDYNLFLREVNNWLTENVYMNFQYASEWTHAAFARGQHRPILVIDTTTDSYRYYSNTNLLGTPNIPETGLPNNTIQIFYTPGHYRLLA